MAFYESVQRTERQGKQYFHFAFHSKSVSGIKYIIENTDRLFQRLEAFKKKSRSPASYVEFRRATLAVFFGGQEGKIAFHMDLEITVQSMNYIHKQPQRYFKFSRPFTGWILLGWDVVAENVK